MSQLDTHSSPAIGNLTAAQRNVLSRAAQRADGAVTLPDNVKGKAAERLAASLIGKGLLREMRAKAGMPVWRRDDKGGRRALIITSFGHAAINAGEADTANTFTAGRVETSSSAPTGRSNAASAGNRRANELASADISAADQPSPEAPRPGSKLAVVIALLQGEAGSSIEELSAATGWLPHTTRAALTGLRKRGYVVERFRLDEGRSSYRIARLTSPIAA